MTTQLTLAFGYTHRDKAPRFTAAPRPDVPMGVHSKWDGGELGYQPADGVQWQRTRPTVPGVYAVVGRDGGVWLGDTRRADADWRGWWCSMTVGEARKLVRPMPPAPDWGER